MPCWNDFSLKAPFCFTCGIIFTTMKSPQPDVHPSTYEYWGFHLAIKNSLYGRRGELNKFSDEIPMNGREPCTDDHLGIPSDK